LPGLVLACSFEHCHWTFVESNHRRSDWLRFALTELGLTNRTDVVTSRAENFGRGPARYGADFVTARSFGPPGPTAECGAPLLRLGGQLLVSDPPTGPGSRWPDDGLSVLGLVLERVARVASLAGPVSLSVLTSVCPCPDNYPRRNGIPFKRPLF